MKTKKQKKSGFTLVELMVVAIIVAILAAVAIPLMTGNRDRAMATEGQAGCTTIATQLRMYWAEHGEGTTDIGDLVGIREGDMDGNYFDDDSYEITANGGASSYTITADGIAPDADGEDVTMTVVNGAVTWGGSLMGEVAAP
jgi:prepilin-type N-terminal cleavage/methylation domain-containing protein